MDEYIEREKVIDVLHQHVVKPPVSLHKTSYLAGYEAALEKAELYVKDIPAADVRPERHGRWIKDGDVLVCSECGEEHAWDDYRATYCEDCGAKMDGKDGEGDDN